MQNDLIKAPLREKFLFIFSLLFILGLFIPSLVFLNAFAIAGLLLSSFLSSPLREKFQLLRERSWVVAMLLFFCWIGLSVLLSHDSRAALRALDPRLPLLYFPISIGLVKLSKTRRNQVLLGIAAMVTIVCIVCLIYSVYRSQQLNNTAVLYNDSFSELTGQQSIYVSLLVNFSIYIFSYFLFYKNISSGYKILAVLAILLLFACSFLLASRNLMIVLYLATIGFAFYYVIRRKKILEGAALLMGFAIGIFIAVKFFPKTINRFKELAYTQYNFESTGPESHYNMEVTSDQWNGANLRMALWNCGWQLFKERPLMGVGLGDKKSALISQYQKKNFGFAVRTERNVHNNYLDILLSLGIIGLLLFLTGWLLLPIRQLIRQHDGLALLMILSIALAMITENYFDRSLGGMLVGFFIPFLLTTHKEKN